MQIDSKSYSLKKIFLIALVCIAAIPLVYIRISNIFVYKPLAGFDAIWHMRYITHLVKHNSLPSAFAFIEAYQPPLYYFLCSIIWRLLYGMSVLTAIKTIQAFSTIVGLIIAWAVIRHLKKQPNHSPASFLSTVIYILSLPMLIYLSPMLGNELLSTLFITLTLSYFFHIVNDANFMAKQACILGCLTGLSLLTKYTGLLVLISTVIVLMFVLLRNSAKRKKIFTFLIYYCICIVCIAGWLYARNTLRYETPLIKANDMGKFSAVYKAQPPGKHSLRDFIFFDFDIFANPVLAHNADFDNLWQKNAYANYNNAFDSIPAGTFATTWIENHGLFLNLTEKTLWKARLVLFFALIPTFFVGIGFILCCKDFIFHRRTIDFALITVTAVSVATYLFYNYSYPYFCHVKAFFLLHLLIPIAIFHAKGIPCLVGERWTPQIILIAFYAVLSVLIAQLYHL